VVLLTASGMLVLQDSVLIAVAWVPPSVLETACVCVEMDSLEHYAGKQSKLQ